MSIAARFLRWHRWLGWRLALQALARTASGVTDRRLMATASGPAP